MNKLIHSILGWFWFVLVWLLVLWLFGFLLGAGFALTRSAVDTGWNLIRPGKVPAGKLPASTALFHNCAFVSTNFDAGPAILSLSNRLTYLEWECGYRPDITNAPKLPTYK